MVDPFSINSWRGLFSKHGSTIGIVLAFIIIGPLLISYGTNFNRGNNGSPDGKDQKRVIGRANGLPITEAEFTRGVMIATRNQPTPPGEGLAVLQGQVLDGIVLQKVLQQEAQKVGARVSDADIERQLQKAKDGWAEGKKLSDAEFADLLYQRTNLTLNQVRNELREDPQMLQQALLEHYKRKTNVSEQDAKQQKAQVKLQLVLIPTPAPQGFALLGKDVKRLPEPLAKNKAEQLLAKAKSGADLAAIARANSGDFSSKKGGITDMRNEYSPTPNPLGALGFGKEFDDAVHATKTGEFTPVVKTNGFGNNGFVFAKVLERKVDLPKDFKVAAEIEQIRQARAGEAMGKDIKKAFDSAKVEMTDPDRKFLYDLSKLRRMEQEQMMSQFGQSDPDNPPPTKAEVEKKQAEINAATEAYYQRNKEDATAILLMAGLLNKREAAEKSKEKKLALQKQIIPLYEAALKGTEDRELRFKLGGLYQQTGQSEKAVETYNYIDRLLNASPAMDSASLQQEIDARTRLADSYKAANATEQVKQQTTKIFTLKTQMAKVKFQEEQLQKQNSKAAPGAPPINLNVPGSSPGGAPVPTPTPENPLGTTNP